VSSGVIFEEAASAWKLLPRARVWPQVAVEYSNANRVALC
jgi:hypothetical protein